MRTAEIKRRFLAHFEANGHTVVPSAPLPAIDDPNLLFINAGMVQFVPYFLGQQAAPFPRAVSVQKCIRTPDIDEVGKTSRHGTFFQRAKASSSSVKTVALSRFLSRPKSLVISSQAKAIASALK